MSSYMSRKYGYSVGLRWEAYMYKKLVGLPKFEKLLKKKKMYDAGGKIEARV